jgi:hypothetical protein
MYDPEPLPTFRDNKDRAVYLLAEYKIPLSIMLIALGIWASYFTPEIPNPPEQTRYFVLSWIIISMPAWILGNYLVEWLYSPKTVTVGVADGGEEDTYTGYEVPPDVWTDARVEGPPPYEPDNGYDYLVKSYDWHPDTGKLTVEGLPRGEDSMDPWEQWYCKKTIDEYFEGYQTLRREYAQFKALVGDKLTDVHDLTIMQMLEKSQDAQVSVDMTVTDLIEEVEQEADDMDQHHEPTETRGGGPTSDEDPAAINPKGGPTSVATDGGEDE